ncbi:hypothetical protein HN51_048791 [Arachis hypogaea]
MNHAVAINSDALDGCGEIMPTPITNASDHAPIKRRLLLPPQLPPTRQRTRSSPLPSSFIFKIDHPPPRRTRAITRRLQWQSLLLTITTLSSISHAS